MNFQKQSTTQKMVFCNFLFNYLLILQAIKLDLMEHGIACSDTVSKFIHRLFVASRDFFFFPHGEHMQNNKTMMMKYSKVCASTRKTFLILPVY